MVKQYLILAFRILTIMCKICSVNHFVFNVLGLLSFLLWSFSSSFKFVSLKQESQT